MFGRGRFQNGVLIQPKEQFDPNDEAKLEEFRNKIWYVQYPTNRISAGDSSRMHLLSV